MSYIPILFSGKKVSLGTYIAAGLTILFILFLAYNSSGTRVINYE